jgi:hypothetical protein
MDRIAQRTRWTVSSFSVLSYSINRGIVSKVELCTVSIRVTISPYQERHEDRYSHWSKHVHDMPDTTAYRLPV